MKSYMALGLVLCCLVIGWVGDTYAILQCSDDGEYCVSFSFENHCKIEFEVETPTSSFQGLMDPAVTRERCHRRSRSCFDCLRFPTLRHEQISGNVTVCAEIASFGCGDEEQAVDLGCSSSIDEYPHCTACVPDCAPERGRCMGGQCECKPGWEGIACDEQEVNEVCIDRLPLPVCTTLGVDECDLTFSASVGGFPVADQRVPLLSIDNLDQGNVTLQCVDLRALGCDFCFEVLDYEETQASPDAPLLASGCFGVHVNQCPNVTNDDFPHACFTDLDVRACNTSISDPSRCEENCEHGRCVAGLCECDDGFAGARCDVQASPCEVDSECEGEHNKCTSDKYCACETHWLGESCDEFCDTSPLGVQLAFGITFVETTVRPAFGNMTAPDPGVWRGWIESSEELSHLSLVLQPHDGAASAMLVRAQEGCQPDGQSPGVSQRLESLPAAVPDDAVLSRDPLYEIELLKQCNFEEHSKRWYIEVQCEREKECPFTVEVYAQSVRRVPGDQYERGFVVSAASVPSFSSQTRWMEHSKPGWWSLEVTARGSWSEASSPLLISYSSDPACEIAENGDSIREPVSGAVLDSGEVEFFYYKQVEATAPANWTITFSNNVHCAEDEEECVPNVEFLFRILHHYDCSPACENGGECSQEQDNVCMCEGTGWTGSRCEEPDCNPKCSHGECVAPDVCECADGWSGPYCLNRDHELNEELFGGSDGSDVDLIILGSIIGGVVVSIVLAIGVIAYIRRKKR